MAIIIFAISSAIAGANITTTILSMRARGMTWNRTPIFVWGTMASVGLAIPAFPMFMAVDGPARRGPHRRRPVLRGHRRRQPVALRRTSSG